MKRWLLTTLVVATALASRVAAETPTDSLYQLEMELTTQDGASSRLDLYRGHPTVVSMFYGSCPHVCPMLIASIRQMERQLAEPERKRLRVLLVSVDPERDDPRALRALALRHRADLARWTFARAEEPDVRKLAAVLGIRYRRLPDGEYNHSTVLSLLDPSGRVVRQTSTLSPQDTAFFEQLRRALGPE